MPGMFLAPSNVVNWANPVNTANPHLGGLVGFWKAQPNNRTEFSANTNHDLRDWVGGNHAGVYNGSYQMADDETDKAPGISYPGLHSVARVVPGTMPVTGFPISMCGWKATHSAGSNRCIMSISDVSQSNEYIELLHVSTNIARALISDTGGNTSTDTTLTVSNYEWVFYGLSIDAGNIAVYANGDYNSTTHARSYPSGADTIGLGIVDATPVVHSANGNLDNLMLFNRYVHPEEWRYFEQEWRKGYGNELINTGDLVASRAENTNPIFTRLADRER